MAIKVGEVTVITGARQLTNVAGITGKFNDFFPNATPITTQLDFTKPLMTLVMSGAVTFSATNFSTGRGATLILDRSGSGHTPTFPGSITFFPSTPSWSSYRYWHISFLCIDGSAARAIAVGFSA